MEHYVLKPEELKTALAEWETNLAQVDFSVLDSGDDSSLACLICG